MLDRLLDELTNLMVFLLALTMVIAYAAVKYGIGLSVLIKLFSL